MPGQFMMHYSVGPSELRHGRMRATVVRFRGQALRERLRAPIDRCAIAIPCRSGPGALFVALADAILRNVNSLHRAAAPAGETLADLLACALEAKDAETPILGTSARAAHRARILRYIADHYRDSDLSPAVIASACGISVRYLHGLFVDSEYTVAEWIMGTRLTEARRLLRDPDCSLRTIGDIAHHCGFEDTSHFSRRFRARFDTTPGQERSEAKAIGCS